MTLVLCPRCKAGTIDTAKQNHCPLCGRDLSTVDILIPENYEYKEDDPEEDKKRPYMRKPSWCWEFFFDGDRHYMACRRPKGHTGPHDEHEDDIVYIMNDKDDFISIQMPFNIENILRSDEKLLTYWKRKPFYLDINEQGELAIRYINFPDEENCRTPL